ncbi:HlyD family secretion protein [Saccharospirillum impatiens]|uniref:HlyD family secretion protein n=1 Tax=Saccharospirillum impatiens TaxID=169438 RepID=UPI0003F4D850|nr:HlyD family efflux transporter periplasmic adaptor subunit [Saccharospirillum impatiens]
MQYSFREIHTLNQLSDNPEYSKRFNVPIDLKVMTTLILLVVVAALTGAIVFKVDKIVPAQGVLEARAKLFEVRSPQAGYIKAIMVTEGMTVTQGAALVSFDTELMDLEIERLQQELATLSRAVWTDFYQIRAWLTPESQTRLGSKLESVPNPIPGQDYQGYLEGSLRHSLAALDQSALGLEGRLAALTRQITLMDASMSMEQAELERLQRLYNQGIESQSSVDARQRSLLELQARLESLHSERDSAGSERDTLLVEREKLKNDFILERMLRLHDQLDQYRQTQSRLSSQQRQREDMTVRAPFPAVVDQVMARGRHEVMDAGAPLVELRPLFDSDDLEIDIRIPSNYAIWVEPGMEFRASSLGSNPEDHGRLHGTVGFVSRSSESVEDGSGQRVYRMTGNITRMDITNPETFLRPGLQLSVEIKAGERRLINYLFDPFTKHLSTALSEPS